MLPFDYVVMIPGLLLTSTCQSVTFKQTFKQTSNVLTDPFMSHLATQLGYSAGEFQALQLIVLVAFGVVD